VKICKHGAGLGQILSLHEYLADLALTLSVFIHTRLRLP